MESTANKRGLQANIASRLQDPLQLRIALCVGLLAAWYFAGYTPMKDRIVATTTQLERDRKRLALAKAVEELRAEASQFDDRLPPRSDPNEFLQYVLAGVRSRPLKLISLSPEKSKEAGPYEVAMVRIELEGKYNEVDALLQWVENDKRLLRVDSVKLEPDIRDPDHLKIQLSVLGLMGVEESARPSLKDQKPRSFPPRPAPPRPPVSTKKPAG